LFAKIQIHAHISDRIGEYWEENGGKEVHMVACNNKIINPAV
jgi:hypothetical protein